jgi:hypothetical protein
VSRAIGSQPVVFTGLSLSPEDARSALPAEIRRPVRAGDLDQLGDESIVAIIDGVLEPGSILSIGEIRRALKRGIKILGAASLGALRAHEAHAEGMEGLGWVYQAYRGGRIAGIEEIGVIFDPLSYRPLTIPLVNVRFCLEEFLKRGAISDHEVQRAMSALKAQPMEERNGRAVWMRLAESIGRERLREALGAAAGKNSNIKRLDALQLLEKMATTPT